MVSSDYCSFAGKNYLVLVDRYRGWPVVRLCKDESSAELVGALHEYFGVYCVPEEITTDNAMVYVSSLVKEFLVTWGVRHRVSTAYIPHANIRAETEVKSVKRLIGENVGPKGTLDTDRMVMALLAYRNIPDRDTGRSPAQVLYARQLSESIPCDPGRLRLRKEWVLTREAREHALAKRHKVRGAQLAEHARGLAPLTVGTTVQVQNQAEPHKSKWDLSGTVVEVLDFAAYNVKMDGSGPIMKMNRKFLRPIHSYKDIVGGMGLPQTGLRLCGGRRLLPSAVETESMQT